MKNITIQRNAFQRTARCVYKQNRMDIVQKVSTVTETKQGRHNTRIFFGDSFFFGFVHFSARGVCRMGERHVSSSSQKTCSNINNS
jgi:hypothetical protein